MKGMITFLWAAITIVWLIISILSGDFYVLIGLCVDILKMQWQAFCYYWVPAIALTLWLWTISRE